MRTSACDLGLRLPKILLLPGVGMLALASCAAAGPPLASGAGGEDTSAALSSSASSASVGAGGAPLDDGWKHDALSVHPPSPFLMVGLPVGNEGVQFTCTSSGTGPSTAATWWLGKPDFGTIDDIGLFLPSGKRAGSVPVFCSVEGKVASTTLVVSIHAVENPGGLGKAQVNALRGPSGTPDAEWGFTYPYDRTVFPQQTRAPEFQLTKGSTPDAVFRMRALAPGVEYEGFFASSPDPTVLQMSPAAWEALSTAAAGGAIDVQVSKLSGAKLYGPIQRTLLLAKGSLHGVVYYNTYDSPQAGYVGAIMRIKGNSAVPDVLMGGCTVCHSVSSDGSTATAADHKLDWPGAGVFDLTGGAVNPPLAWANPELGAFAALYPKNGDVFVVNAAPGDAAPPNTPGTTGSYPSALRKKDGKLVPDSGIEAFYAQTPVFSHDGSMLAFTDRQPKPPYASVLSLLQYHALTHKFDHYKVLAVPPSGRHNSWPAFTPNNQVVVYQNGTGDDLATWNGNTGRLQAVDLTSGKAVDLANLNGDEHVPRGARDRNKNYEPTIAPVASGGYFWVMFTSRRTYGNKLTGPEDKTKRLWVAALDIDASPGVDPSHPAFYLPGQELNSGNSRGFWALEPCKTEGISCALGDECCQGFCNPVTGIGSFTCGASSGRCANEFEFCSTNLDCCDSNLRCMGGRCALASPK